MEYIKSLEQDKTYLLAENSRLERLVYDRSHVTSSGYQEDEPTNKRRKMDTESSDEGVGMTTDEAIVVDDLRKQLDELRQRLEYERQLRMLLEQQQLCLVTSGAYANKPTDGFPDIDVRHSVPMPAEGMALRGSLETIVAAIQHLEGSQDMPGESQTCGKSDSFTSEDDVDHDDSNSAHSTSFSSDTSLQLPASELMRVVAAAEALQFFAERHATMRGKASQTFPCILQPLRSSEVTSNSHHIRRIFHSSWLLDFMKDY